MPRTKPGDSLEARNRPSDAYFRNRILEISDRDFWSALSGRESGLQAARRLAAAGRRQAAYLALAEHHRRATVAEWEHARREARERNADPGGRRAMLSGASDARAGRVGYHSVTRRFGRRIDFSAYFGRSGTYGFHYLGWLVPLVDRLILDGKTDDLARITEIVEQYYRQRGRVARPIADLHPVYYELGSWAKTTHLLPAYLAMVHAGRPRAGAVEAFMKLFLGFGRSLLRLQSSGYRAGNWQIVGATALFRLGAAFPELREAARWRRRGAEIILAHLRRDFYADGGHKERCWGYGWMSLKGVISFYETARRSGLLDRRLAGECLRGIRRAFRWFAATVTPAGVCPAYGDGDLFRADEILAAARRYLPAAELDRPRRASVILRPSGYAVMRDGASGEDRYLNLNFGEWGGGHTHQDLLDFNVWAFGEPLIEEVGRFDSYDHPLGPFFYSPEAHNQIVVDHHAMDRRACRGEGVRWRSLPALDYFSAWHDGYRSRRGAPRVHRQVLFVRGEYWLVYDRIEPADDAGTIFSVSSYLHSPWPFRKLSPERAVVAGRRGRCLLAFAGDQLRRLETGVDVAGPEVTVPRLYAARRFLRARMWGHTGHRGSLSLATLILPYRGRAPRAELSKLRSGDGGGAEIFEVRTAAGRDRVSFALLGRGRSTGRGASSGARAIWQRGRRKVVLP